MMLIKNSKYRNLIITIATIVAIVLVGYKIVDNSNFFLGILNKIISLSTPFLFWIVIAYILNPVVKLFEKRIKLNRVVSILLTYAVLIGIIVFIAVYGIPGIVDNIKSMILDLPKYMDSLEKIVNDMLQKDQLTNLISEVGINVNFYDYIDKISKIAMTTIEGSINTIVNLSSTIFNLVLGILISVYVLIEEERLISGGKRFLVLILKEKRANKLGEFIRVYNKMIGSYIGIKAIDSAIIGLLAFILLNIVDSQYALVLAVIVAFTNMIPYFGPLVGELVGFLINVFISPTKGIIVFLTLFGLQMFDGWYLDPKLVGDRVGVRPFWLIYAVVIGGGFFGPIGMLLASPTVAVIKIYYEKMLIKRKLINLDQDEKDEVEDIEKNNE